MNHLNQERTVYLITDADAENVKERDYKTFNEWLEVECHSVVLDTVGGEIYDDES